MAFVAITNLPEWEYDNAPPDPGGAQSTLWATGVAGIRTAPSGTLVYMYCRKVGSTDPSVPNEINKTYWDSKI